MKTPPGNSPSDQMLLDHAPIGLRSWDISSLDRWLKQLRDRHHVTDFEAYFREHPSELMDHCRDIKLIDVNQTGLEIYGADTKRQFKNHYSSPVDFHPPDRVRSVMIRTISALARDETSIEFVTTHRTIPGDDIRVRGQINVLSEQSNGVIPAISYTLNITKQAHYREKLEERERKFRSIFNQTFQLSGILEPDGTLVEANQTALDMIGCDREDVEGQLFWETPWWSHDPYLQEKVQSAIRRARYGDVVQFEARHPTTTEDDFAWVQVSIRSIQDESGEVNHLVAEGRDITPFKQAQHALEQSRSQYRSLFERSPIALIEQDFSDVQEHLERLRSTGVRDFETYFATNPNELKRCARMVRIQQVNQAAVQLYDAPSEDELLEASITDLFVEEHFEGFQRQILALIEGENLVDQKLMNQTLEGEEVFLDARLTIINKKENDWSRVLFALRDVTERIEAEEKLRESEKRFRQLAENIEEVFWINKPNTNDVIYVSPAYKKIWGYEPETLYENPDLWIEAIHEDDRERVQKAVREKQHIGEYDEIYRIVRADGEQRWIHDRAFPIENERGNVYRIAGLAEDITERKKNQERLEQSLEEKELLLKEVHHRVRNNMQVISSLLGLQMNNSDRPEVTRSLRSSKNRIHSMALIHQKLYEAENIHQIPLSEYVRDLVNYVVANHVLSREQIDVDLEVEDLNLEMDAIIPCGIIINELVTNALKHGIGEENTGSIWIELVEHDEEHFRLAVQDNGQGWEQNPFEQSSGLGFRLIQAIGEDQLDGTFHYDTEPRTSISLIFPRSEAIRRVGS